MTAIDFTALATRIEIYLLTREHWVSVDDVCRDCGIAERLLRADGRRRPIFGRFAISSSTKGLKHMRHTTDRERIAYKHARKKVLIANARALKEYDTAIRECLTGKHPNQIEVHTAQGVFKL
jgi:hypothetical protein